MKRVNRIKIIGDNEGTSYPYWIIIDPKQNFKTNDQGVHNISGMIEGVWFSRKAAEDYLKARSYEYSKNARVFCKSGYWSTDWRKAVGEKYR